MARFFAPTVEYKAPTFQELAAPLAVYQSAYNDLEEKYDAQKEKAAMLQAMLGSEGDNEEISSIMSDFNTLLDQTARGYSNGSMPYSQLYNNYRRLKDIWQDKGLKMTNAIDLYTKYRDAKKPGYIGPDYSLTDFYKHGNTLSYSFIDPSEIEKESSNMFKSLSASMPPQLRGSFMNDAMVLMSQGMSANDILTLMQNDSPYSPFVQNLQSLYGDTYAGLDEANRRRYDSAIQRGAFAGLEQMKATENPILDQQLKNERLRAAQLSYKDALMDYNNKVKLNNTWTQLDDGTYINALGIPSSTLPSDATLVDQQTFSSLGSKSKSKSSKQDEVLSRSFFNYNEVWGYPNANKDTKGSYVGYSYKDPSGNSDYVKSSSLPATGFSYNTPLGNKVTMEPYLAFDKDGNVVYGKSVTGSKIDKIDDMETGTLIAYGFENGSPSINNINATMEGGMSKDIPKRVQKAMKENPNLVNNMSDLVIMKTTADNYVILKQK